MTDFLMMGDDLDEGFGDWVTRDLIRCPFCHHDQTPASAPPLRCAACGQVIVGLRRYRRPLSDFPEQPMLAVQKTPFEP
jgi:hypothetical protein